MITVGSVTPAGATPGAAASAAKVPEHNIVIEYFPFYGRAENIKMMLAYHGVPFTCKDIKMEDELIGLENFIDQLPIYAHHKKATNLFFKIKRSHFGERNFQEKIRDVIAKLDLQEIL